MGLTMKMKSSLATRQRARARHLRSFGGLCAAGGHRRRLRMPRSIGRFLDKYCVTCHSDKAKTAGLVARDGGRFKRRTTAGHLGKSCPQAARGRHAPAGTAAPGPRSPGSFRRTGSRPGLDRAAADLRPGPAFDSPAEPHGVCRGGQGRAGCRRGRRSAAPGG